MRKDQAVLFKQILEFVIVFELFWVAGDLEDLEIYGYRGFLLVFTVFQLPDQLFNELELLVVTFEMLPGDDLTVKA